MRRRSRLASPSVAITRRCLAALGLTLGLIVMGGTLDAAAETTTTTSLPNDTTTTTPSSTTPDTTTTTSSTTTSTTTTLPEPGAVIMPPPEGGLPGDARFGDYQATPTLPPPTSTTTTLPDLTILPDNSGTGRRVVYSKSRQRVWLVNENGTVERTHLVSGRLTWNQPTPNNLANEREPEFRYYADPPAFYRVASRSAYTCNIKNPAICWRYMVRFTKGPEGDNIGLHEIPNKNGRPVQTESQLGIPLSGGCIRQATPDAQFVWDWAWMGTKVVVLG